MHTAFSWVCNALHMQDASGVACAFVKPRHHIMPVSHVYNLCTLSRSCLDCQHYRPAACISGGTAVAILQTACHGCRWSWLWAFGMGDVSSGLPLARGKSYAEDQRLTDDSELSGADCRTLSKCMSTLVPRQSGLAGQFISQPMSDKAAAYRDMPKIATLACGLTVSLAEGATCISAPHNPLIYQTRITLAAVSSVARVQGMRSDQRVRKRKASTRLPWLLKGSSETRTLQLLKQSPLRDLLLKGLKVSHYASYMLAFASM